MDHPPLTFRNVTVIFSLFIHFLLAIHVFFYFTFYLYIFLKLFYDLTRITTLTKPDHSKKFTWRRSGSKHVFRLLLLIGFILLLLLLFIIILFSIIFHSVFNLDLFFWYFVLLLLFLPCALLLLLLFICVLDKHAKNKNLLSKKRMSKAGMEPLSTRSKEQ